MLWVAIVAAVIVCGAIKSLVINPGAKLAAVSVFSAIWVVVIVFGAIFDPGIVPSIMCCVPIELSAILDPSIAPSAILDDVIAPSAILSSVIAPSAIFSVVTACAWMFCVFMIPLRLILNATLIHFTVKAFIAVGVIVLIIISPSRTGTVEPLKSSASHSCVIWNVRAPLITSKDASMVGSIVPWPTLTVYPPLVYVATGSL
jgi:hypothetical protein